MSQPLALVAVGDLQLGDSPTTVGYGFYSRYGAESLEPVFAGARSPFAGADIVFGNLETTLVGAQPGETSRSALQLRGALRFAKELRIAGFTILNVANNHAVQHGDDTFHETVAALRVEGIACCGVRGSGEWASQPAILERKGVRVGVLGYCRRPRQYGSSLPPYAEGTQEQICADVERLRAAGTLPIVSLHWGEEFVPHPSSDEVSLGRAIIDAGAALIIGHHPHVTRPVERYGSGVIAYSLGNFVGDMIWYEPFRTGAILHCTIDGGAVTEASVTPTRLGDDYRPTIVEQPTAPVAPGQLVGMDSALYARSIAQTMSRQRLAAYRSAVLSLPRIPWPILSQLVTQTIANKLSAVRSRLIGRSGRY